MSTNSSVTPIDHIYGNLQGLKPSEIKQLQRLYRFRLPQTTLVSPELAQRLITLGYTIDLPLCLYGNRRGQIIRVAIGTPNQTKIPPLELPRYGLERLSGLRCVSVSLRPEPPTEADLVAMTIQKLDSLVTLTLEKCWWAYPVVPAGWAVSAPMSLDALTKQDFSGLIGDLEAEFSRTLGGITVEQKQDRVILAGLSAEYMDELQQLVESAGGVVLDRFVQQRSQPHPQTVLGEGKIHELMITAQTKGANLVVFDRELSPAQIRNLEQKIGVRVSDRTEVILDIFAQRARSAAGKLQVELAQMAYRLPRLAGRGQDLSRLGGGIGTRGPGETKLESDRRVLQKRISHLQKQVNDLQNHRARQRQQRVDREIPTLAIVGYTNAGKSTLLNQLTKANAYTADQMFATLDPTTRRLNLKEFVGRDYTILLTDTVGFIHELPPSLVSAFRATLEEVTEADALIHLVDAAHSNYQQQMRSVEQILGEMPLVVGEQLLVFNKIDLLSHAQLTELKTNYPHAVFISAQQRQGFRELCQRIFTLCLKNGLYFSWQGQTLRG
ncbi:MAG: GTPase HflX [Pseudanabaenaceae cyanobacterium]